MVFIWFFQPLWSEHLTAEFFMNSSRQLQLSFTLILKKHQYSNCLAKLVLFVAHSFFYQAKFVKNSEIEKMLQQLFFKVNMILDIHSNHSLKSKHDFGYSSLKLQN